MDRKPEAEDEFKTITAQSPGDLLSAAQLGFLYLARGDKTAALPLLQRVIDGNDAELANRVRAALQLPQVQAPSSRPQAGAAQPPSVEAKTMAERSVKRAT
jgi:thioredoxin-like negative regulator of GroEL